MSVNILPNRYFLIKKISHKLRLPTYFKKEVIHIRDFKYFNDLYDQGM